MADLDRIREALRFIPVGGNYERWQVAAMIYSDAGEAGRDLWDEWRGDRGRDDAESTWRSARKDGDLQIGTLFYDAKAKGWQPSKPYTPPTLEQRAALAAERKAAIEAAAEIERQQREAAKAKAARMWNEAHDAAADHPYLVKKGIQPEGVKQLQQMLLLPIRSGRELVNLQLIGEDGSKRFLTGGQVKGAALVLGELAGAAEAVLCEGWATGVSLRAATGLPVVVAFNAGNLPEVAGRLAKSCPELALIVAGDNDASQTGQKAAEKAAATHAKARWCCPAFTPEQINQRQQESGKPPSDFNDLHQLAGLEEVAKQIKTAAQPAKQEASADWPEPQSLTAKIESAPYPLDALPETIRAAVGEVAGFVKAPIPLVVSSALAALSLACQAYIDVKRAEKLQGPVGLFLLTIADSGERKSTCDRVFAEGIRQYEKEQAEALQPVIKQHQAAIAAWEAERDGILMKIKTTAKESKPTDELRAKLERLQLAKPEPPRIPRLMLGDETPENLAWSLAKQWPSVGVLSSEAGVVFGSHGMGKDSAMRNLALLNVLWDGGEHSIGRRTSESFIVRGARLTMGLMIQEATLREYFSKSGGLARGTGFLARFLVAWPESTQGTRFFKDPPENWPALAAFHRRITEILNQPAPIDEDGTLEPFLLPMTPAAKAAWVEYYDAIEKQLAGGGDLYDVRDVASKSADNAARLAALFQMFEIGSGAVDARAVECASRITAWHLNEARRFFGELALPVEQADAVRLDGWLVEHCQRERTHFVSTRNAQRLGPIRDKDKLASALQVLEELERVRVAKDGRQKTIKVNPALVLS